MKTINAESITLANPAVTIPWSWTRQQALERLAQFGLRDAPNTTVVFMSGELFAGIRGSISVCGFEPRTSVLRRVHVSPESYGDLRSDFLRVRSVLETLLGPGKKASEIHVLDARVDGFHNMCWEQDSVRIEHVVLERFGPNHLICVTRLPYGPPIA
jgi:hypothetical protein